MPAPSTERVRRYREKMRKHLGDKKYKDSVRHKMSLFRIKKKNLREEEDERTSSPERSPAKKRERVLSFQQEESPDTPESDSDEPEDYDEVIDVPESHSTPYAVLRHPFTCVVAGPSQSGKTMWVMRLLQHKDKMIKTEDGDTVNKIVWYYGSSPSIIEPKDKLKDLDIEFKKGLPEMSAITNHDPSEPMLIVLDDLMLELTKHSNILSHLFTRGAHHSSISCIFIVQNIFPAGGSKTEMRNVALNANYRVFFDNSSDRTQLADISRRTFGNSDAILQCIKETGNEYSYAFVDCHPKTPDSLKLRSNIFPDDEENTVFVL